MVRNFMLYPHALRSQDYRLCSIGCANQLGIGKLVMASKQKQ